MKQIIKASEAREQWSQLLNSVFIDQKRVVVEKSGIPVAVVISVSDFNRLTELEMQRAQRFKILDEVGETFKKIPTKQLLSEVTNSINQIRSIKTARKKLK